MMASLTIIVLFCRRYDSEGKYLASLPDLATPRAGHACSSFFTNGEQVKISPSCLIIFLLYFKQALLVAGGGYRGYRGYLVSTEIYSNGVWRTVGNLPRWKHLSNHLNYSSLRLQLSLSLSTLINNIADIIQIMKIFVIIVETII